jgi:AraC family transcriptional regulator
MVATATAEKPAAHRQRGRLTTFCEQSQRFSNSGRMATMRRMTSHTADRIAAAAGIAPERLVGCTAPLVAVWAHAPIEAEVSGLPQHAVALHLSGSVLAEKWSNGRVAGQRVRTGSVSLVPAMASTRWIMRGAMRVAHLYVDPAALAAVSSTSAAGPAELRDFFNVDDVGLASLVRWALAEGDALDALAQDQLLNLVHGHLLRRYAGLTRHEPNPGSLGLTTPTLRRVCDHIDDRIAAPLRLADLAREAGLSEDHFLRAFKLATGITPHRYVQERRVLRAKALLASSDKPIADVGRESGFVNASHFASVFTRSVGVTPTRWRAHGRKT